MPRPRRAFHGKDVLTMEKSENELMAKIKGRRLPPLNEFRRVSRPARSWPWQGPVLEGIDARTVRDFEIADIGTKTNTDTGADWHHVDPLIGQRGHPDTADQKG